MCEVFSRCERQQLALQGSPTGLSWKADRDWDVKPSLSVAWLAAVGISLSFYVSDAVLNPSACDTGNRTHPSASNAECNITRGKGTVLLQMGVRSSASRDVTQGFPRHIEICAVQDNHCFDMSMATAWDGSVDRLSHAQKKRPDRAVEGESSADKAGPSVQLVVTRAGEDLRWLDAMSDFSTLVYNRAGPESLLPKHRRNLEIVTEANHGREDEVMLQHIIDNYDALPDVTVFLQGWPFGHCPGTIKTVRRVLAALTDPHQTDILEGAGGAAKGLIPISRSFWQYSVPDGLLGLARGLAESHFQPHDHAAMQYAMAMYNATCSQVLGGKPCPSHQWVAEGAQWAVTRERIRFTPRHVYQGALKLGEGYENKFRGLVLEALWPVLFGEPEWKPLANKYAQTVGLHCQADGQKRSLLFSCEERMAFCELRHRQQGFSESHQFLAQRHRYEIYDAMSSVEDWSMVVELRPVLWGAATWSPLTEVKSAVSLGQNPQTSFYPKLVVSNSSGELHLESIGGPAQEAVHWKVTEFRGAAGVSYHFEARNADGNLSYLGCDHTTGIAKLSSEKTDWIIKPLLDGWSELVSADGVLHLWREDGGKLHCSSKQTNRDSTSTFLIYLIQKQSKDE
eukprot:CAMPEP_0115151110 /NCGR_PEP_ID=MMETSP0227-20121206/65414_1 /TAXON_ID=89957 /ORGANISM="Polarella glacialis, Strain CCMP 1383" /LENGTH=623 /DNA_ID=CAMNT_0002561553 /DNA_START=41 /DNA_END=1913 /DNA_ORIENTATION=-